MPDDITGPPQAKRVPHERTHHGETVVDDYEWLREKESPETTGYLEAENAWTEASTAHLSDLRQSVFDDIAARTKQTDLSVPTHVTHRGADGSVSRWWYYGRTVEGQQYGISCRVPATQGSTPPDPEGGLSDEQVLLDGNVEAGDSAFFSLGGLDVSRRGDVMAYAVDDTGAERYTVRFRDLATGEALPDVIEDVMGGVTWTAADDHVLYTRADDAWRPYVVMRHALGTASEDDVEVFREDDERYWLGVGESRDGEWLMVGVGSKITSEAWLLPADDPTGELRCVAPRREGVEYDVEPAGDRLLVLHNDGAEDFELAEAPLDAGSHEQWQPVIAHEPGRRLTGVDAYEGHVVLGLRRDGLTAVRVIGRTADGDLGEGADLEFEEPVRSVGAYSSPDYDATSVRLSYTSLVTPPEVLDHDVATGERHLRKQREVLDHPEHGAYDPADYVQSREWVTAPDGVAVPVSLVRRKDVPLDGSAPCFLYGYGSYEASMDPYFSVPRLSLLDRGFVYAIAHVRGGGEMGRRWYEDGKTLTKKNTFTDFVAVARHLAAEGFTSADRLVARGGSAGGLLIGAAVNLAPDAFAAVHADVPFVDALTTILDPSLPLTVIEWDEWGDPLHDPEVYAYMRGYSPYDNVEATRYPAILATTSLNDTRVYYVEPAKWIAKLRTLAENDPHEILLKTEMVAGHGGVSGRYDAWRDEAFALAWLIERAGAA
ncbi:oligopeptidase B [Marmoricola endophyticus]|uniref:Oligopeptidase B n=1 Tax=Marmoricola endophyticus TaxID=2040280 RepID=A0A917BFR3_9ACTN|nr:S9 family peptidase [Marmoricola endophyticus]GGF38701.1 oligopeptidase B [Marmoricola endophyticus]